MGTLKMSWNTEEGRPECRSVDHKSVDHKNVRKIRHRFEVAAPLRSLLRQRHSVLRNAGPDNNLVTLHKMLGGGG